MLTAAGAAFLTDFGVDVDGLSRSKTPMCRSCLDWSARQTHLAGSVGRALLMRMQDAGWAKRVEGTRVVRFTTAGEKGFAETFGS